MLILGIYRVLYTLIKKYKIKKHLWQSQSVKELAGEVAKLKGFNEYQCQVNAELKETNAKLIDILKKTVITLKYAILVINEKNKIIIIVFFSK